MKEKELELESEMGVTDGNARVLQQFEDLEMGDDEPCENLYHESLWIRWEG